MNVNIILESLDAAEFEPAVIAAVAPSPQALSTFSSPPPSSSAPPLLSPSLLLFTLTRHGGSESMKVETKSRGHAQPLQRRPIAQPAPRDHPLLFTRGRCHGRGSGFNCPYRWDVERDCFRGLPPRLSESQLLQSKDGPDENSAVSPLLR